MFDWIVVEEEQVFLEDVAFLIWKVGEAIYYYLALVADDQLDLFLVPAP